MKHSYSRFWIAALPLALGVASAPSLALAEEAKDESAAESESAHAEAAHGATDEHSAGEPEHEEEDEGHNVISVKLAGLELVIPGEGGGPVTDPEAGEEGDEVLRRVGVSVGIERVLIPGWLDAELSVLFAPGPEGLTLPIDLVLKKPFEISHSLEACIGAGLATEWFENGEAETAYGLSTTIGGYYWVDPHIAIVLDGEYNLLVHPETAHEFVLASGAAVRF